MKKAYAWVLGKTEKVLVVVELREVGQDGGVAVRVFGDGQGGVGEEHVRIDIFRLEPHWHRYGPRPERKETRVSFKDQQGSDTKHFAHQSLRDLRAILASSQVGRPDLAEDLSGEDLDSLAFEVGTAIESVERGRWWT